MDIVSNPTSKILERLLDVAAKRQQLIASNIANVDTPGYSTRDLDFDAAMQEAAKRAAAAPGTPGASGPTGATGPAGSPRDGFARFVHEPEGLARRNDFNNVSIDREMLALSKTAGRFSAAVELLRKRFALLRYAISDGRGGGA